MILSIFGFKTFLFKTFLQDLGYLYTEPCLAVSLSYYIVYRYCKLVLQCTVEMTSVAMLSWPGVLIKEREPRPQIRYIYTQRFNRRMWMALLPNKLSLKLRALPP